MIKLANCTMHDQTAHLEAFRAFGFEVEAFPRLREVAGAEDALALAKEVIRTLPKGVEGILLGGRTDLCIYLAIYAATRDLPVFIAETKRERDMQDRFVFNLIGVTPIRIGYPEGCNGEIAAALFPKKGVSK